MAVNLRDLLWEVRHNLYLSRWNDQDLTVVPEKSLLACVMVEPRKGYTKTIARAVKNMVGFIPYASYVIVCSLDNLEEMQNEFANTNVHTFAMMEKNEGRDGFNVRMKEHQFWDYFQNFYRVLIFQSDSGIRKNRILYTFKYGYVGAPWENRHVGNGGFSLRDPRLMSKICKEFPNRKAGPDFNEDLFFSQCLLETDPNALPPFEMATEFSTEHAWKTTTDPMAYHQGSWCPPNYLDMIFGKVPFHHRSPCPPKFLLKSAEIHSASASSSSPIDVYGTLILGCTMYGMYVPKNMEFPLFVHQQLGPSTNKTLQITYCFTDGDNTTDRSFTVPISDDNRVLAEVDIGFTE